jgi:hypothetical protein
MYSGWRCIRIGREKDPDQESTTTTAIVTDDFVASFRFDCFGCEGYPAQTTADVLQRITVGARSDDVTQTEITDAVAWGSDANRVEKISISVDIEAQGLILEIFNPDVQGSKLLNDEVKKSGERFFLKVETPIAARITAAIKNDCNHFLRHAYPSFSAIYCFEGVSILTPAG